MHSREEAVKFWRTAYKILNSVPTSDTAKIRNACGKQLNYSWNCYLAWEKMETDCWKAESDPEKKLQEQYGDVFKKKTLKIDDTVKELWSQMQQLRATRHKSLPDEVRIALDKKRAK